MLRIAVAHVARQRYGLACFGTFKDLSVIAINRSSTMPACFLYQMPENASLYGRSRLLNLSRCQIACVVPFEHCLLLQKSDLLHPSVIQRSVFFSYASALFA